MWIIVDKGEVFEGTLEQFQDCFFSNANQELIQEWADKEGWSVIFINETPSSYRCKYCKDTGMVTLFSFSKPCLDCPPSFEFPEFDEVVDIIEYGKRIPAECTDCGWIVEVLPGTFGYDSLMDENCYRAKCAGCGLGGRTFTRI